MHLQPLCSQALSRLTFLSDGHSCYSLISLLIGAERQENTKERKILAETAAHCPRLKCCCLSMTVFRCGCLVLGCFLSLQLLQPGFICLSDVCSALCMPPCFRRLCCCCCLFCRAASLSSSSRSVVSSPARSVKVGVVQQHQVYGYFKTRLLSAKKQKTKNWKLTLDVVALHKIAAKCAPRETKVLTRTIFSLSP